jgi:uncharacterized protein
MNEQSPVDTKVQSIAEVETPKAGRYLQQLCKHFQHKLPVTFDEHSGQITFSIGECRLNATEDVLKLRLEAQDGAQMTQLQDVVARHLLRFAFREEMQIDWRTD